MRLERFETGPLHEHAHHNKLKPRCLDTADSSDMNPHGVDSNIGRDGQAVCSHWLKLSRAQQK